MKYYALRNKEMPWGLYGAMLWQGEYVYNRDSDSHIVFRTGPYCPEIYKVFSQDVPLLIGKYSAIQKIKEVQLTGLRVFPAIKGKIVKLDWENWDATSPEPQVYPGGDRDAEEYITRRKHDPSCSAQIGELFALLPVLDGLICEKDGKTCIIKESLSSQYDIFTNRPTLRNRNDIFISERARDIFISLFDGLFFYDAIQIVSVDLEELNFWEKMAARNEEKLKLEKEMTESDWQHWHKLLNIARNLIGGIKSLKTESTKNKRKSKIFDNLNEANAIYPVDFQDWMKGYWKPNQSNE